MGIELTAGTEATLIEEAIDSSYRKGGLCVSMTDSVSKQTVKNKIHELVIEEQLKIPEVKKKVEILYIDADEDHIAEQAYSGEKGTIIIGKIIYLYEGKVLENDRSKRRKLIGKHYFGGVYGLMRSRKNETYTFEFKLHVVELYLSTEVSYQELALSVGINNPPLITKWVNDFRIAVPDALRPKRKGRRSKVSKPKESKSKNIKTTSNNSEYLNNLKMKISN